MKRSKKIIISIVCIILSLVLIYNILWFFGVYFKYKKYQNDIGFDENKGFYFYRDEDDYTYSAEDPFYFSFTNNLAVTKVLNSDESGEIHTQKSCDLIIWTKLFRDNEYGVSITDKIEPDDTEYSSCEIYLDANGKPIDELDEDVQKIYEKNIDEIRVLYSKARNMWGSDIIE